MFLKTVWGRKRRYIVVASSLLMVFCLVTTQVLAAVSSNFGPYATAYDQYGLWYGTETGRYDPQGYYEMTTTGTWSQISWMQNNQNSTFGARNKPAFVFHTFGPSGSGSCVPVDVIPNWTTTDLPASRYVLRGLGGCGGVTNEIRVLADLDINASNLPPGYYFHTTVSYTPYNGNTYTGMITFDTYWLNWYDNPIGRAYDTKLCFNGSSMYNC